MSRTVDDVLASFPAGSVTALPAGDVALLVAEVERLRQLLKDGNKEVTRGTR